MVVMARQIVGSNTALLSHKAKLLVRIRAVLLAASRDINMQGDETKRKF